jgi:hypothetical protein
MTHRDSWVVAMTKFRKVQDKQSQGEILTRSKNDTITCFFLQNKRTISNTF